MTNKFLRYDGTKWNLDNGLVGPQGLPGVQGIPGPAGNAILVWQPGGSGINGNIFASWTDLMSARGLSSSPMTIVVDFSITNVATIDAGIWNFGGNTKMTTYTSGGGTLEIPVNAQLLDANEFENFNTITLRSWSSPNLEFSQGTTVPVRFLKFNNCSIQCFAASAAIAGINFSNPNINPPIVQVYGDGELFHDNSNIPLFNVGSVNTATIELYDNAHMHTHVVIGSGGSSANVFISSPAAICEATQDVPTLNVAGGNLVGAWQTAANGTVLTKTGVATADWLPGGGALNGDVTGASNSNTVVQITGDNFGNVNIIAFRQTFTGIPHFVPYNFIGTAVASGSTLATLVTAANLTTNNTGIQLDVVLTAISSSGADFASWKLSYGALKTGAGAPVSVGSVPNPAGVIPDRATVGASGWLATMSISGNTILVQGQAVAGVRWGFAVQGLPVNV